MLARFFVGFVIVVVLYYVFALFCFIMCMLLFVYILYYVLVCFYLLLSLFVCWVGLQLPITLGVKAIGVRMSIESKLEFQIQMFENIQKSNKKRGFTFAAVRGRLIANNID